MANDRPAYLAQHGPALITNGYRIVPITPGQKYPANLDNWEQTQANFEVLDGWLRNGRAHDGVGILTEWTPAVDIDVYDETASNILASWIDDNIGVGKLRIGQAPKQLLVFKAQYPFTKTMSGTYWIRGASHPGKVDRQGQPVKVLCKVEILGAGQQFVAHAIHPDTRAPYNWIGGDLLSTPWPCLDELTHDQAKLICAQFDQLAQTYVNAGIWEQVAQGNYHAAGNGYNPAGNFDPLDIKPPNPDFTEADAYALLWEPEILARAVDRGDWIKVGAALSHQFAGSEEGKELWRAWSETADNYAGDEDIDYRWTTFKNDRSQRATTIALLYFWQKEARAQRQAFLLDHLEDKIAQFTDYDVFVHSPVIKDVKNFLADHPEKESHIAKLLKAKENAPRIDTLKKSLRTSKALAPRDVAPGQIDYERHHETGAILTTQNNVALALSKAGYGRFGFDEFVASILVSIGGSPWRAITDMDYTRVLMHLETIGFSNVPKEKIRDGIELVAHLNAFDSAIDWGNGLAWDGMPRVYQFMSTYLGMPDTEYNRAVSLYMWSGMAGRLLSPGIKLDMVPIFISEEGLRKTSLVWQLSPIATAAGQLDMAKKGDDISRAMKGKLILEWPELKGIKSKDEEYIKAFFTETREEWIPKYREHATIYLRRCFIVGTANGYDVLPAYGKARRWLPLPVTIAARVEALIESRVQLWAEAIHLFKTYGILWQEADRLAVDHRDRFREEDPLLQAIDRWLNSPETELDKIYGANEASPVQRKKGDTPFKINVLIEHLMHTGYRGATAAKLGPPLRALGYDNVSRYYADLGKSERRWCRTLAQP